MAIKKEEKCFSSFAKAFAQEVCAFVQEAKTIKKEEKCFSSFAKAFAQEVCAFVQEAKTIENAGKCFSSFAKTFAKKDICLAQHEIVKKTGRNSKVKILCLTIACCEK